MKSEKVIYILVYNKQHYCEFYKVYARLSTAVYI